MLPSAALLKHWGWPARALPALRRWVRCDFSTHNGGIGLLEAILAGKPPLPPRPWHHLPTKPALSLLVRPATADADSASGAHRPRALAAASVLALGLAKALRQGCLPANRVTCSHATCPALVSSACRLRRLHPLLTRPSCRMPADQHPVCIFKPNKAACGATARAHSWCASLVLLAHA